MGAFLAYTIYTGIFLLFGFLFYKLMMASEKQSALNRVVLAGIYILSFAALPVSTIDFGKVAEVPLAVEFGGADFVGVTENAGFGWQRAAIAVYYTGLAATLAMTIFTGTRLAIIIARGRRKRCDGFTLVLLPDSAAAPFSWGRYIVMSEADYASAGELIIAHERAHIHFGHTLDIVLAQLVCVVLWYNPAAWLMREELKAVHEYQADGAVLDSGVDARKYQMLLIKKAVGTRFQSLANSLNHSKLKQRITMMYKEKNRGLRRLRGLALCLAPALAVAVVNIPAVASSIASLRVATVEIAAGSVADVTDGKISENPADNTPVEVQKDVTIATFPGGEEEMFRFLAENIKYPAKAMEKNIEGRSVVSFTVEADGTLSGFNIVRSAGAILDQEAVRVIMSMPKWIPATKNGTPVATIYTLPVSFRIKGDGKNTSDTEETDDAVKVVGYGTIKKAEAPATEKCAPATFKTIPENVAVFVDGVRIANSELSNISPDDIASITVKKDNPEYPDGAIYITMK